MAFPIKDVRRPAVLNGLTNGNLPDHVLVDVPGTRLLAPAARAYLAMRDAAAADGIELNPTSAVDGFRPYSVQERIFRQRYRKGVKSSIDSKGRVWNGERWYRHNGAAAAVPGTSNHGWGLAIDIANASGARLRWLLANADRFGFSWELQSEPWHLRYYRGDDGVVAAPPTSAGIPTALLGGRELQEFLAAVGEYKGAIDGKVGPQTKAAIKRWQSRIGVTADGEWGPVTQSKSDDLFRLLAAQKAPAAPAQDPAAVRRWVAGVHRNQVGALPNLDGNSVGLEVAALRDALAFLTGNAALALPGQDLERITYSDDLIQAVWDFQRFFKVQGDFPGAFHANSRWALYHILEAIRAGKA